ncbi:hypothetical protein [Desertivirga arenae]|uniref:hypothetical protein n=1 Tax=Desertivirga arenae TaxID=2810309 RepID=UPI001A977358|nr:hypothetical protein [Pedobacter sp. SYSU D00823]
MKNFNVKNPLARPWLFAILLTSFAFGQLISTLLLAIFNSSPDLVILNPSVNFSMVLWAVAIATTTPELRGIRIIQIPVYLFMVLQMLVSLIPHPHLTGLTALLQVPQLFGMISGFTALIQITILGKKYLS